MSQLLATCKRRHQSRLLDMSAWTKSTEEVLESHGRQHITTHYNSNQGVNKMYMASCHHPSFRRLGESDSARAGHMCFVICELSAMTVAMARPGHSPQQSALGPRMARRPVPDSLSLTSLMSQSCPQTLEKTLKGKIPEFPTAYAPCLRL